MFNNLSNTFFSTPHNLTVKILPIKIFKLNDID